MEIEEAGFQFGLLDAQGPHVHEASGFLVEVWVLAEVLLQPRLYKRLPSLECSIMNHTRYSFVDKASVYRSKSLSK